MRKKTDTQKFRARYTGKRVPWTKLDGHQFITGTNNEFAFVFIPRLNLTFQSIKESDVIIRMWQGKHKPTKEECSYLKKVFKKMPYTWYQKLYSFVVSWTGFVIMYIVMFPIITVIVVYRLIPFRRHAQQ